MSFSHAYRLTAVLMTFAISVSFSDEVIGQLQSSSINLVDYSTETVMQLAPDLSVDVNVATGDAFESPVLRALVANGMLPPVVDRLPPNPHVIASDTRSGYSHIYQAAFYDVGDWNAFQDFMTGDGLVRFDPDTESYLPNVAERWEWSADETEITLHLRQGIRWSDGTLFTSEDVQFWFADIQHNPNLVDVVPLRQGRTDVELTVVDAYTVRYAFDSPVLAGELEGLVQANNRLWPAHYYRQYHPLHNPHLTGYDELRERIAARPFIDVDRPVLQAWSVYDVDPDVGVLAARNPYYWKVDEEGRQLPYIDILDLSVETTPVVIGKSLSLLEDAVSLVPRESSGGKDLRSLIDIARTLVHAMDSLPDVYSSEEREVFDAELRFLEEVAGELRRSGGETQRLPPRAQQILSGLRTIFGERERIGGLDYRIPMSVWVKVTQGTLDEPSNGLRVYLQPPFKRRNGERMPEIFVGRSQVEGETRWAGIACYFGKQGDDVVTDVLYGEPVRNNDGRFVVSVHLADWGWNSSQASTDEVCK